MFDTTRFLNDHFGSPQRVIGFLRAYKLHEPSIETVRKWFQRAAVPSEWLPVLLAVLELDEGHPVSLATYIKREEK